LSLAYDLAAARTLVCAFCTSNRACADGELVKM
jgi:hypothetical protein